MLALAVFLLVVFYYMSPMSTSRHPIEVLIEGAEKEFQKILSKETFDLKSAAQAYRQRRGRHPPPGFDKWFEFAQENDAIIIEDFFDQIYHDLAPFWGVHPATMRREGVDNEQTISIRNHVATAESDWFWTKIWLDLIKSISHMLPDMDLNFNAMDEPRIVVPWEQINDYMKVERKGRVMPPAAEIISQYQSLPPPLEVEKHVATLDKSWEDTRGYS